jgi:hypothetical protein
MAESQFAFAGLVHRGVDRRACGVLCGNRACNQTDKAKHNPLHQKAVPNAPKPDHCNPDPIRLPPTPPYIRPGQVA